MARLLVLISLACLGACYSKGYSSRFPLPEHDVLPDLYDASIDELQDGLTAGHFSSVDLVKAYFARIDEVNLKGPALHAVIETNPTALMQAAALDKERHQHGPRGSLHGIPVLLKDNIATVATEGMNTTAGSFSLLGSVVPRDATVVARLRAAGAIILGKANLSELAGFRNPCPAGWSGRGGQSTSPYYPGANPGGSSSGSAIAASIGLAAVTLGTETDGSISTPASRNNIVSIKPTVGLTSRAGILRLSVTHDSVGPMSRSMADAAIVLSVIAGKDSTDNYTDAQPSSLPDYTKALNKNSLRGKRIGVLRELMTHEETEEVRVAFDAALKTIRDLGATIVDPADFPNMQTMLDTLYPNEFTVMTTEFKASLDDWYQSLEKNPSGVQSLRDLIKFNNDHADVENPPQCGEQALLIQTEKTKGFDDAYYAALASESEYGREKGIDAVLKKHNLDALVMPPTLTVTPSAAAGYPIVTVPLGFYRDNFPVNATEPLPYPAPGLPFGLSFLGTAYSEFDLIGFGYAFEERTKARLSRRAYGGAIPKTQLRDIIKR